ncbi:unnamed protein product [Dovyalis caffra]|uniref:Uncharacterized protein n=1 Tax=Dovyalis caffra TaxID=77055 RepID=A0AAV1SLH3_9ROSI|nr:unnamed protein product [Dovyalis caffra]
MRSNELPHSQYSKNSDSLSKCNRSYRQATNHEELKNVSSWEVVNELVLGENEFFKAGEEEEDDVPSVDDHNEDRVDGMDDDFNKDRINNVCDDLNDDRVDNVDEVRMDDDVLNEDMLDNVDSLDHTRGG